jgi:hypothetical protein
MMNWETFKTLNKEQREEYKFKFMDMPRPSSLQIVVLTIILMLSIIVSIFVSYIVLTSTDEKLIVLQDEIKNLIHTSLNVTQAVAVLIVLYVLYDAGNLLSYVVREYWWRKKNKVKYRYDSWMQRVWSYLKHIFV